MFNNIRYNNWIKKINRLRKQQKTLGYMDKVKIFAQARAGKLSRAQCDELISLIEAVVIDSIRKSQIQNIVNFALSDDYTVKDWHVRENELVIEVKESEKIIRLYTVEDPTLTLLIKCRIELNGKECKTWNYYMMSVNEFVELLEAMKACERNA